MSQPQQPSQPAAATAPGPIDQKDIEYWSNQMNSALADFNGTVNNKSPAGASQWANGFFSCFNPIETCLLTWCCPCVTFGRTYHRLHKDANLEGYQPVNTSCLISCGSMWVGVPCIPIAAQRAAIRARYNLEGSCITDLLCGWCCSCCSLVQMDKEVERREKQNGDTQAYQPQAAMSYPGK